MNEIEVGQLLAMAITLDQRMPEPDEDGFMRRLWATMLHDVPRELGQRALVEYYRGDRYAQTRESITPADIVQWSLPRQKPEGAGGPAGGLVVHDAEKRAPRKALEVDPQRIRDGYDRVIAEWQGRKAIRRGDDPEFAMDIAQGEVAARRAFLSRPCSHCGAAEGSPCVSPATGMRLTKSPAHDARLRAAEVAAAASREVALAELGNVVVSPETLSSP